MNIKKWILDEKDGFKRGYKFTDCRGIEFVLGGYSVIQKGFNAYPTEKFRGIIGEKSGIIHALFGIEDLKKIEKKRQEVFDF